MSNKTRTLQPYYPSQKASPKQQTLIIVYEQPKVVVVRHYTRTLIPQVNPDEYRRKFDRVLLDTTTLLDLTRRLNIEENMVNKKLFLIYIYLLNLF